MKPFIRKDQFSPHVDITAAYAAIEAIEAIETIEAIEAIERALEDELRALETLGNCIGTAADELGALDAWSGSTTQPTRALGRHFDGAQSALAATPTPRGGRPQSQARKVRFGKGRHDLSFLNQRA